MDAETFTEFFHQVPPVQINSGKDIDEYLKKYHDIFKDQEKWKEWVECFKKIRSLILANSLKYDEFYDHLNKLLPLFLSAIKSLRSTVVREACITIAFLSMNLGNKFDFVAESILSNLIELIQKSQKVFAYSGIVCIRYVIRYTQTPRLILTITNYLNSKNKDIRRACCEFIYLILQIWPKHIIERFSSELRTAIKKGIVDADADARSHSRKASAEFDKLFPHMTVSSEKCRNSRPSGASVTKSRASVQSRYSVSSAAIGSVNLQAVKQANARNAAKLSQKSNFETPVSSVVASKKSESKVDSVKNHGLVPVQSNLPQSRSNHHSPEISPIFSIDRIDLYETPFVSSACSPGSGDGAQHSPHRQISDPSAKDIDDMLLNIESSRWDDRQKGLISLQYYIQEGTKLELRHLKRIMDLLLKIFNDPHIKVFSLFLDTLNELILSYSVDLYFCLHLLLTRLFNKLGADLLMSVHSKIEKTLDNLFIVFPHDLLIQSVFRFLIDQKPTSGNRVELAAVEYIFRLASTMNPYLTLSPNNYVTMALTKMISWTMGDFAEANPRLCKATEDAIFALFNLNPSQVTGCFSGMSVEFQEKAASICKSKCPVLPEISTNTDTSPVSKTTWQVDRVASGEDSRTHAITESVSETNSQIEKIVPEDDSMALKSYLDELSQADEDPLTKKELLLKIAKLVEESSTRAIIVNFKRLMVKMISFMKPAESEAIKVLVLDLLQLLMKRQIVDLLKNFSDLITIKVLSLCSDSSEAVVKSAQRCALLLSMYLPVECVVRICVPLIASEAAPIKLTAIKMLTHLVEWSDDSVFVSNIDQIMPILISAYDDVESSIRKAAIFLTVALHKQSEKMKMALEPYISELESGKSKLLQLYIDRAEQGLLKNS